MQIIRSGCAVFVQIGLRPRARCTGTAITDHVSYCGDRLPLVSANCRLALHAGQFGVRGADNSPAKRQLRTVSGVIL